MATVMFHFFRMLFRPCVFTVVSGAFPIYSGTSLRDARRHWRIALRGVGQAIFVSGPVVVRVRF